LKNTSTKDNKFVVNQKLEHVDEISFTELFGRIRVVFFIPMGTNCAPLLADLFLYSYEVDFIQGLLKKNEKKLARSFNIKFRYIDDGLSLNNSGFGGSVASLLAATLYQGNPDRNHKLWNIVSTERYILHMQVLLECCYI
jgi:hypothetical protein